jgi:hypothetical protein
MSEETPREITVEYQDGYTETVQILGKVWSYANFVCWRTADSDDVSYIPAANVRRVIHPGSDR